MNRREFLGDTAPIWKRALGLTAIATLLARCSKIGGDSPTAPSSTTPLLTALRRDHNVVEEITNSYGGVTLRINGKLPNIKVGTALIGIDPNHNGPPTLNVGQYPIPDNIGYLVVD